MHQLCAISLSSYGVGVKSIVFQLLVLSMKWKLLGGKY
jgi:hypothetical protein